MMESNRLLLFMLIIFNITSLDCEKYLAKFNTFSNDGKGASKLQFDGSVNQLEDQTENFRIVTTFFDPLMNDMDYFGIVEENGVPANKVCFYLKLFKYSSTNYSDPQQVTDLQISGGQNLAKKQQYLIFSLPKSELDQRTIKTENSNNFIYFGYYSLSFYQSETHNHQYSFYFSFAITINKLQDYFYANPFFSLNYQETAKCSPEISCQIEPSSQLLWCSDFYCQQYIEPQWHNKGIYYLKQKAIGGGMENYYLNFTTIYFYGNGLCVNITPQAINNTIIGETVIQFEASLAWDNVTIFVTSYLNNESLWQGDPVNGWIFIEQIPFSPNVAKLTCEEECVANEFSKQNCKICVLEELTGQYIQALIGFLLGLLI